jgi:hypothetical protein
LKIIIFVWDYLKIIICGSLVIITIQDEYVDRKFQEVNPILRKDKNSRIFLFQVEV